MSFKHFYRGYQSKMSTGSNLSVFHVCKKPQFVDVGPETYPACRRRVKLLPKGLQFLTITL